MAGTSLEIAQSRLDLYLAAEAAILGGAQEYTIGDRRVKKGDLAEIRLEIRSLQLEVSRLQSASNGGSRCFTVYSR
jgi:hypothetical protein